MSKIAELIQQREAITAKIEELSKSEKTDAINQIRVLMMNVGLTLADLGVSPRAVSPSKTGRKVAAKYRDRAGNSWSGRGLKPKWLKAELEAGAKIEDFTV